MYIRTYVVTYMYVRTYLHIILIATYIIIFKPVSCIIFKTGACFGQRTPGLKSARLSSTRLEIDFVQEVGMCVCLYILPLGY